MTIEHDDPQGEIRRAIRRRRRTLGLTQDDAAQLMKMSRVTYHRMERGNRRIRCTEFAMVCELYDCSIDELAGPHLAAGYRTAAKAILGAPA
jgi:transcriptional regulator with XRE-family HTH domain